MVDKNLTHYLWLDVETTGLDISRDPVIEIACVVTDILLHENIRHLSTPIHPGKGLLESRLKANPFVQEMHTKNGLLSCLNGASDQWPDIEQAEHFIIQMLEDLQIKPKEVVLAGSGVAHFDRFVIERQMPRLSEWFYYRPLDIGNIRSFVRYTMQRPDLLPPEVESNHRAFDDVLNALAEARMMNDRFSELKIVALDEEG